MCSPSIVCGSTVTRFVRRYGCRIEPDFGPLLLIISYFIERKMNDADFYLQCTFKDLR